MTIEHDAIHTDAGNFETYDRGTSLDEATEAYLKKNEKDAEKPSEPDEEEENPTGEHDADEADGSHGNENESEDDEEVESEGSHDSLDDDEHEIKHTFAGKELNFKIKDAKQAMGERAAVKQKSMALAETAKAVEATREKYAVSSNREIQKAAKRLEPYQNFDWNLAANQYDPESYKALKADFIAASQDLQFYQTELQGIHNEMVQERQTAVATARKSMFATLEKDVSGFSPKVYGEVRDHLVSNGIPEAVLHEVIDPSIVKYVHKMMMMERSRSVQSKPVNKSPTKVLKQTNSSDSIRKANKPNANAAMNKARKTGSIDDMVNAYMKNTQRD